MMGPWPKLGKTIQFSPISEFTRPAGITVYLIIPVSFTFTYCGLLMRCEVQQLLKEQLPLVSECHVVIIVLKPWLVIMVSHDT